MADTGQMRDRIKSLQEKIDELLWNRDELIWRNAELEEINEKFRLYMRDIAVHYVNNCPHEYLEFANSKMEEVKNGR